MNRVCKFLLSIALSLTILSTIVIYGSGDNTSTIPYQSNEPETEVVNEPEIVTPSVVDETDSDVRDIVTEEKKVDSEQLELLARVIYQEAGGNGCCDMCRYRVADVVLNRIENGYWGDTMLEVLLAEGQYGRFHWTGVVWADRASSPNEADAVRRAYEVAEDVLRGNHSELYGQGYIWQAEFVQGTSGFWCCNTYFGKN